VNANFVLTRHVTEEAAVRQAAAVLEEWGYEVKVTVTASQVVLLTDALRHSVVKARQIGKTDAQDLITKLMTDVSKYTQYPPCETETK